ncbi:GPI anchored serine-threonine rich family protein, partial [Candidatus Omnitrophota bacterium]
STFGTIPNVYLNYSTNNGNDYDLIFPTPIVNIGEYYWTLPDEITNLAKVKISDINDPLAMIESGTFFIHGDIDLTDPDGGEQWKVNTSQRIEWILTGSIANVLLEYTDDDQNYTDIVASTGAAAEYYDWTIPDSISDQCRVRISDTQDSAVTDSSQNTFKIIANVTVDIPNSFVEWKVAEEHDIEWTILGTVTNVKIELSTDGGTEYTELPDSPVPNNGAYTWTIPDSISSQCKIRISDSTDSAAIDASDTNFKIRGDLTLVDPNGAEQWGVGSKHDINWTSVGNIIDVKLKYYYQASWDNDVVAGAVTNNGTYEWTIPDTITTQARVRVQDDNDPTVYDDSDADFKIQGRIVMTNPTGGEIWLVSSGHTVTWDAYGSFDYVDVEYSIDSGQNYTLCAQGSGTPNDESFTWTVPDVVKYDAARIKVSDSNDADAKDESGDFTIRATFGLSAPNGGQDLTVDDPYTISWTHIGTPATVDLQLHWFERDAPTIEHTDSIATDVPTSVGGDSYSWTIPDSISDAADVIVSDTNDSDAQDSSDATFRIIAGFEVLTPNASSKWYVNDQELITWNWTGTVVEARLEYQVEGGAWGGVGLDNPNDGSYLWLIPDDISDELKVRVSDSDDAAAVDVSTGLAKIRAKFTLTDPNGGEELVVDDGVASSGDEFQITWDNLGTVDYVDLHFSTDDFTTPQLIVSAHPNAIPDQGGSYDEWEIPNEISHTVKVRVMSWSDTDAFDISDADFRIMGALEVTQPNTEVYWDIYGDYDLLWDTTGTIPNVDIFYSKDNFGSDNNTIASGILNTGTHPWNVPDDVADAAKIRVVDSRGTEQDVFDDSDVGFHIIGNFTITAPNGGENWEVDSQYSITWTWGGTIDPVILSYSKNGGGAYTVISSTVQNGDVANPDGSGGPWSYLWTVPDEISTNCLIKIEDPGDETVFDVSDASFKIQGRFTLGAPNGAERWVTNEEHAVSWTTWGAVSDVRLTYSTTGFASENSLLVLDDKGDQDPNNDEWVNADSIPNTGSATWRIPDDRNETVRVRVYDANDADVYDESDANFKIDYYTVLWDIRDLLTDQPLTQLSVEETSGWNQADLAGIAWDEEDMSAALWAELEAIRQPLGDTPPYEAVLGGSTPGTPDVGGTPYGFWTATWTKVGYGDVLVSFNCDSDQVVSFQMETTAVHIWRSYTDFVYTPDTDTLDMVSWLERDGSVISGAVEVDVYIYDSATGEITKTMTSSSPDSSGFFFQSWADCELEAGKTYPVITRVRIAAGGKFRTPSSFSVTTPKKLQEVEDTVNSVLDKPISQVSAELQQVLTNQTTMIEDKLDVQKEAIDEGILTMEETIEEASAEMQAEVTATLTSFEQKTYQAIEDLEAGADRSLAASEELVSAAQDTVIMMEEAGLITEQTARKYSGELILPNTIMSGEKLQVRYSGLSGLMPYMDIIDSDNNSILNNTPLTESGSQAGMYEYEVNIEGDSFVPGEAITIIVIADVGFNVESMEVGSVMVESTSLTAIEGMVSMIPQAKSAAEEARDMIMHAGRALENAMKSGTDIDLALTYLQETVESLPKLMAKEGPLPEIVSSINDVSERLMSLAGEEGYDMTQLMEQALSKSPTLKDMRIKTDQVGGVIDLLRKIFEAKFGGMDAPVVSNSLHPGSVVFRIAAANPSATRTQTVPVQIYLPTEVEAKDILDQGGLELDYDSDKGAYFLYDNSVELAPQETRVFDVEVEDIWMVPDDEMGELRTRASRVTEQLKDSDYYQKAADLTESINLRLDEVATVQKDDSVSRNQHIGYYRTNLKVVEEVEEDLDKMEKLLTFAGGPPVPELLEESELKLDAPSTTTTWMIIFIIIIFVAVLAAVFFFTWYRQRSAQESFFAQAKESAFPHAQETSFPASPEEEAEEKTGEERSEVKARDGT